MKPLILAVALALGACTASAQGATNNLPPDAIYVDPATAGWNAAALADAVTYVAGQKSTGFVIIQDGRIVAEHYWPLPEDAATFRTNFVHGTAADGALLEDVASQQKSFIAILIGVGVDRKLVDIEKARCGLCRPGLVEGFARAGGEDHCTSPDGDDVRPQGEPDLRSRGRNEILLQHACLRRAEESA
jgi:hypothetical protein